MVEVSSKSSYGFKALLDSDNYDIFAGEQHLGRLYVFPVTEAALVAQGIEKQWFLSHQTGDLVLSGHINQSQQWSLSQPRSLEPSGQYVSQSELLATVFSEDYIEAVRNSQAVNRDSPGISRPETVSASQPVSVEVAAGSSNSTGPTGSSEGQPVKVSQAILAEEVVAVGSNLSGLPLGIEESEESEGLPEEQEDREAEVAEEWEQPLMAELEQKRQQLERQLAAVLLEGYQRNWLDFEADERDSAWQLAAEGGEVFSIYSRSDGHVVLSVTRDGEILKSLAQEDLETIGWTLLEPEVEQQQGKAQPRLRQVEKSPGIELD